MLREQRISLVVGLGGYTSTAVVRAAAARGTPLIVIHEPDLTHALKEVDAAALAVAHTPEQVVGILRYVTQDEA